MAIASIACPKCTQTFRSSDDVLHTRIRCPLCGTGFVVKKFVADVEPPIARAKAKSPEEVEDATPYKLDDVSLRARCPNCANEMASEDAIICVFCGYNTQTRTLGKTKKVIQQTGMDRMTWLWPGIGCAIGIVALVILQIIYVLGLGRSMRTADSVIKYILNEPIYLWVTLMMAGAIWKMGTFAFRRLIIEPTPPEIEAD